MHLFFDESGDYAFPQDEFDCYVQAALICPDATVEQVEAFVAERKRTWRVDELHATKLDAAQVAELVDFIASTDVQLLASVTDTELVTKADIERHRLDQAASTQRNLDWYRRESTKARGAPVPEIEEWMLRNLARAGLASRVSHGEFVQAQYLIHLIRDALQKAVIWFSLEDWRHDSWDFHFVLDAKLPKKMAAGERYLNEVIVPSLGSQQGWSLDMLDTWKNEPVHPFISKYSRDRGHVRGREVEGVTDLKAIFEPGLRFESSHEHAGLQLVDAVAYTVRRAVMEPDDPVAQATYDKLRPQLVFEPGRVLTIHRLRGSREPSEAALERYRPLHALERA